MVPSHYRKQFLQFLKKLNRQLIQPSGYTPGHLPKIREDVCSNKNLYTNVYSSSVHSCPPKLAKPNVLQLVNGQTVVHACTEYCLAIKRELLIYASV